MAITSLQKAVVRQWLGWDRGNGYYESGVDAMFISEDDFSGIKFFKYEEAARTSFHWSKIFFAIGFGVMAWDLESVTLTNEEGGYVKTVWFYRCEKAVCLKNIWKSRDKGYELEERLEAIIARVNQRLTMAYGIQMTDCHIGNWGLVRGRVVPIDLGQFYCNNEYISI